MPPAAPGKSLGTLNNPATVQIQFAYDSLRRQINRMLGDLARAWCLEQKRQNMVLRELTKINPTTVMSSIYGKAVAANWLVAWHTSVIFFVRKISLSVPSCPS